MSETINIQGTLIEFPSAGQAPSYAEPLIQFAEAVEAALSGIVGTYDISYRSLTLDAIPNATATDVPSLAFPTTHVRGAFIRYTVYRTTSLANAAETGTLTLIYNANNSTGLKWECVREAVGDGSVTFTVEDTGQVQITLTALSGTSHVGLLNYSASAVEQSY